MSRAITKLVYNHEIVHSFWTRHGTEDFLVRRMAEGAVQYFSLDPDGCLVQQSLTPFSHESTGAVSVRKALE